MSLKKHYSKMKAIHERTYHEHRHAQAELDLFVGGRLQAHQEVILSVLKKCNGLSHHYFTHEKFLKGEYAWAVAMAEGFEIVRLTDDFIYARNSLTMDSKLPGRTFKIPQELLYKSNREIAKLVRNSVKESKARAKAYRDFERRKEVQAAKRALAQAERQVEKIQAKLLKLEPVK